MAAKDLKPVKVCPECGRTMVASWSWRKGNRRGAQTHWHDARSGLCDSCSRKAERKRLAAMGLTIRGQKRVVRRYVPSREISDILDEYELIRDDVLTIRDAAQRMGIGFSRLDKMLYMARKRGDSRGNPPLAQKVKAELHGVPFGRTGRR